MHRLYNKYNVEKVSSLKLKFFVFCCYGQVCETMDITFFENFDFSQKYRIRAMTCDMDVMTWYMRWLAAPIAKVEGFVGNHFIYQFKFLKSLVGNTQRGQSRYRSGILVISICGGDVANMPTSNTQTVKTNVIHHFIAHLIWFIPPVEWLYHHYISSHRTQEFFWGKSKFSKTVIVVFNLIQ